MACFLLLTHWVALDFSRALFKAGSIRLARMAMIAITIRITC